MSLVYYVTKSNKSKKSLSLLFQKKNYLLRPTLNLAILLFLVTIFVPKKTYSEELSWGSINSINDKTILVPLRFVNWTDSDLVSLKNSEGEIVGLFDPDSFSYEKLNLVYLYSNRIPQPSDTLQVAKLDGSDETLHGTTRIWKFKEYKKNILGRYKTLFTQGSVIGDTAQTLLKHEYMITSFGGVFYGLNNSVTLGTNIPALVLGSPNARLKAKAFHGEYQTWSFGVSMAQDASSDEKLMNIDLIWDSVLSDKLVAHSILSAAVISFDEAKDVAALKSYGSSSIQSGYEYIMEDWGRILAGPSYNIEQKAIGGYFSYVQIFDHFHIQFSLTTNNLRVLKFSTEEGYLAFAEAYWRF